jgi:hypothetical protein
MEDEPKLERIHDEPKLEGIHKAGHRISRHRTSTNQLEITIKNKMRFSRNSNNTVKGSIATNRQRESNNQNQQVREYEALEIGHSTRDTISWQRTSTNQFEIAIKNKSRFALARLLVPVLWPKLLTMLSLMALVLQML